MVVAMRIGVILPGQNSADVAAMVFGIWASWGLCQDPRHFGNVGRVRIQDCFLECVVGDS